MQSILTRWLARLPARWHRWLGLMVSNIIYFGRPFAVQRLVRLYRPFLGQGSLAFDVGAHVGNRTAAFRRLQARVVAVEPNPSCLAELDRRFSAESMVRVVPAAIDSTEGETRLRISRMTPSVSTTSESWLDRVRATPGFAWVDWDEAVTVPTVSLDRLIARYGPPEFCKLDVEGSELAALNGLSQPLPAVSFEHTPSDLPTTNACIDRLEHLADYEYNWSMGERARLQLDQWLPDAELRAMLSATDLSKRSADIFARRVGLAGRLT